MNVAAQQTCDNESNRQDPPISLSRSLYPKQLLQLVIANELHACECSGVVLYVRKMTAVNESMHVKWQQLMKVCTTKCCRTNTTILESYTSDPFPGRWSGRGLPNSSSNDMQASSIGLYLPGATSNTPTSTRLCASSKHSLNLRVIALKVSDLKLILLRNVASMTGH
jgi:hypothetical protein